LFNSPFNRINATLGIGNDVKARIVLFWRRPCPISDAAICWPPQNLNGEVGPIDHGKDDPSVSNVGIGRFGEGAVRPTYSRIHNHWQD
jgi:hypothetical protein